MKIVLCGVKDPVHEKVVGILNGEGVEFFETENFLKEGTEIKPEDFSAFIVIYSSEMEISKIIDSIKNSENHADPALVVIANPRNLKIEEAFKAGADDYVEKKKVSEELIPRLLQAVSKTDSFKKLRENALQLRFLYETSGIFNSSLDIDVVIEQILQLTVKITDSVSGTIFLTDSGGNVIKKILSREYGSKKKQTAVVEKIMQNGLAGWVYQNKTAALIKNTDKDKRWIKIDDDNSNFKSAICMPIVRRENVLGLLTLHHEEESHYDERQVEILTQITNQAAISIENSKIFSQLHYLSMTDELTDLFNRRLFFTIADKEYFKATRFSEPLSLLLIDIDDFKKVNDVYGHLVGDQIIKKTARILKSIIRNFDVLARYGGDEFMILLPRTDLQGAVELSKKILKEFQDKEIEVDGRSIKITNSIGIAEVQKGCENFSDLLRQSDKALYRAKYKGKNRMDVYY
ncbi:diguanylate cyclase [candidate division WOR-3 bacterium]|nr:diguanylate cyclase [candidate division WOR-3 bacterium]